MRDPDQLPFPPLSLANRVGAISHAADPYGLYSELGRGARDHIVELLPGGWTFEGKRVLDFGCGAGRTLRHFFLEAQSAEFWGCDIDSSSVEWLERELSPPFRVFRNDQTSPLPFEDHSLDLIYAISVFSHLTDTWADWLLELHRILRPDGLLIATFIGEGLAEMISGEPWDERLVGMNILRYGESFDIGGPMVLHSQWWIEQHWGRLFEISHLQSSGFHSRPGEGQGVAVLRPLNRSLAARELERPATDDPRVISALMHNLKQTRQEMAQLRMGSRHHRALSVLRWLAATRTGVRLRWVVGRIAGPLLPAVVDRARRFRRGR